MFINILPFDSINSSSKYLMFLCVFRIRTFLDVNRILMTSNSENFFLFDMVLGFYQDNT